MERDLDIVVYMGGCCGDLVSALIDPTGARLNTLNRTVDHCSERQRLKKHALFADDTAKDNYLQAMSSLYLSVPSHDLEYHVRRQHRFIGILVRDSATALWAARRFKQAHRLEVWQSIKKSHSIDYVEQYAQLMLDYSNLLLTCTDLVIDLEDIVRDRALSVLAALTNRTLGICAETFYNDWLQMQSNDFNTSSVRHEAS